MLDIQPEPSEVLPEIVPERPNPFDTDLTLLPSSIAPPIQRTASPLTPLIVDRSAIAKLLGALLHRGGLSILEVSRRMGTSDQNIRQYLKGRRTQPSLFWFVKLVESCGGRIYIEFPTRGR